MTDVESKQKAKTKTTGSTTSKKPAETISETVVKKATGAIKKVPGVSKKES